LAQVRTARFATLSPSASASTSEMSLHALFLPLLKETLSTALLADLRRASPDHWNALNDSNWA
jgi:hypothetical protein